MEKIPSFQKNHDTLPVGLHAQTDENGITTFDLRFKKPNGGDYICSQPCLETAERRKISFTSDPWAAARAFIC